MCHQECATVPANPFPEPTNGKAVAMWKHVKDFALPEGTDSTDNSVEVWVDHGRGDGVNSPAMAGIAQAALAAAAAAKRKTKKPRAHASLGGSGAETLPPACGESDSSCAGGSQGPPEERESSGCSGELESSRPLRLGDTKGGNGDGNGSSATGMRQESYYLRGAIEADRDRDLLATITDCIPGDVAYQYDAILLSNMLTGTTCSFEIGL